MSRPIGQNAADIQVDDALWSGVYRERLVSFFFMRGLELQANPNVDSFSNLDADLMDASRLVVHPCYRLWP